MIDGDMNGVYDVAKLTEFDCWGCCSKIKCEIGSMDCVAVKMSKIACDMIMDGWNYEVSQDYCKPIEHNYTDVRIPF